MNDNILTTAVKIAKVIDDGVERDEALSKIAQVQAAVNYPENALETISQIRYADIRADAVRKSLDNLLTRFYYKRSSMPQMDMWIDKLMEEAFAIPKLRDRCLKLHQIILFILPRLNDKELTLSFLRQARDEFVKLDNVVDRCKYLFTACEMYQQLKCEDEALTTLDLIQERISEIDSIVQQGLLFGLLANEFWKMQDYMSAFECIGRIENGEVQSYACLQLAELLAVGGKFSDAEQIIDRVEDEKQKSVGEMFIGMGKFVFRSIPQNATGFVVNINKTFVFNDELNKENPDSSADSKEQDADQFPKPRWVDLLLVVQSDDNSKSSQEESEGKQDDLPLVRRILQENRIESYTQVVRHDRNDDSEPWKESDDDDGESWKESDDDDGESWKESDDDDGESWKESDDDDGESWKESDDDDGESWKESDDDEDESWKELDEDDSELWKEPDEDDSEPSKESDEANSEPSKEPDEANSEPSKMPDEDEIEAIKEQVQKWLNSFNNENGESGGEDHKDVKKENIDFNFDNTVANWRNLADFIKKCSESDRKFLEYRRRFAELGRKAPWLNPEFYFREPKELPQDKYFCLSNTSQGIVIFNQPFPEGLLQQLLRKICKLFNTSREKADEKELLPWTKEKIDDFLNRVKENGFDNSLQEVISQGEYQFAVDCALNHFCSQHKDNLYFGCEYFIR